MLKLLWDVVIEQDGYLSVFFTPWRREKSCSDRGGVKAERLRQHQAEYWHLRALVTAVMHHRLSKLEREKHKS